MLRNDHLGEKSRALGALLNRLRGLARRLHRAVTGIFPANVLDHDELRGDVFVAFAGLFAELAQILAAGRAMLFGLVQIVDDAFPLQVPRQWTTATRH